MKTRKPRCDAWYARLTVAQQDEAWRLCNELGFERAASEIARRYSLSRAPSLTALSNWWRDWPLRRAFADFGSIAEQVKAALRDLPDLRLDRDQIETVAQAVFTAAALRRQDPDLYATLRRLSLAEQQLALDRERLELLRRKAAQADAAQAVAASSLTPEEKAAKFREIFGLAPS